MLCLQSTARCLCIFNLYLHVTCGENNFYIEFFIFVVDPFGLNLCGIILI